MTDEVRAIYVQSGPSGILGGQGLVLGFLIVVQSEATRSAAMALFGLAWMATFSYWCLWLLSYRLELTDKTLRWRTPLRRGEIPLGYRPARIREAKVYPWRGLPDLMLIDIGRARVRVFAGPGFAEFAETVQSGIQGPRGGHPHD
jgi:hypothetical protein